MSRIKRPGLALVLALAACAPAGALGAVRCEVADRQQSLSAARTTSAVRAAHGLGPVTADARLDRAAAAHACDMARRGRMSHRGGSTAGPMQRAKVQGYAPRIVAENIAAGPFGQSQVLATWARSGGHARNILIPQVRDFGIGRAVGADGRTVYWAAIYAAPR